MKVKTINRSEEEATRERAQDVQKVRQQGPAQRPSALNAADVPTKQPLHVLPAPTLLPLRPSGLPSCQQVHRNLDPALHPFEKAKEYTRALNAGKAGGHHMQAAAAVQRRPGCSRSRTHGNLEPVPHCGALGGVIKHAMAGPHLTSLPLQPSSTECLPSPSWRPSRTTTASPAWPATRAASTRCCLAPPTATCGYGTCRHGAACGAWWGTRRRSRASA